MKYSDDFLNQEVDIYHDPRPIIVDEKKKSPEPVQEKEHKDSNGLFGIFKSPKKDRKKKEQSVEKKIVKKSLSDQVLTEMKHSDDFLKQEVDIYHGFRPIIQKKEKTPELKEPILEKQHGLMS